MGVLILRDGTVQELTIIKNKVIDDLYYGNVDTNSKWQIWLPRDYRWISCSTEISSNLDNEQTHDQPHLHQHHLVALLHHVRSIWELVAILQVLMFLQFDWKSSIHHHWFIYQPGSTIHVPICVSMKWSSSYFMKWISENSKWN